MAPSEYPFYCGSLAKPAEVKRSIFKNKYMYAITVKPLYKQNWNDQENLDSVLDTLFKSDDFMFKKYELDKKHSILHVHGYYNPQDYIQNYRQFTKHISGYIVDIRRLQEQKDVYKWLQYLQKDDPNDQVLIRNYARTTNLFS